MTTRDAIRGTLAGLALIVALFGVFMLFKVHQRYQRRADANNRVKVTQINIRNANQQALVVRAEIAADESQS